MSDNRREHVHKYKCFNGPTMGLKVCDVCKKLKNVRRHCLKCGETFTPVCNRRFVCMACSWANGNRGHYVNREKKLDS